MKNVIKKTCAIVMMTAVLFTAVAPTPVLAACNHDNVSTEQYERRVYFQTTTHYVSSGTCTVTVYRVYKVKRECLGCKAILDQEYLRTATEHSLRH